MGDRTGCIFTIKCKALIVLNHTLTTFALSNIGKFNKTISVIASYSVHLTATALTILLHIAIVITIAGKVGKVEKEGKVGKLLQMAQKGSTYL